MRYCPIAGCFSGWDSLQTVACMHPRPAGRYQQQQEAGTENRDTGRGDSPAESPPNRSVESDQKDLSI